MRITLEISMLVWVSLVASEYYKALVKCALANSSVSIPLFQTKANSSGTGESEDHRTGNEMPMQGN
jgi:hypothetical protein